MTPTDIAEPEFLVQRRAAAAAVVESTPLPQHKGAAGWEFTPIGDLDLAAFPDAPGGAEDAAEHLLDLDLDAAVRPTTDAAVSEGPVVLPLALAAERHPDIVERHLGSVVALGRRAGRAQRRGLDRRHARLHPARRSRSRRRSSSPRVHEQAGTTLHQRLLVVLEEGARAEVWHQTAVRAKVPRPASSTASSS